MSKSSSRVSKMKVRISSSEASFSVLSRFKLVLILHPTLATPNMMPFQEGSAFTPIRHMFFRLMVASNLLAES